MTKLLAALLLSAAFGLMTPAIRRRRVR